MLFIKSFFQILNSQINVKYTQTTEETENGKIYHKFAVFDASNVGVSGVFAAKVLAKKMGKKVFPFLNKLSKTTNDKEKLEQILKTKSWVYKKAVWHPALVKKCTHKTLEKMKKISIPLSYKEIYKDTSVIAILHDIGRLSEVDIVQGAVCMKRSGLNKTHAAIGFDILEHANIKPEILLAIKYHEFADVDEAKNDTRYQSLPEKNRTIAEFYIRLLQDMDKKANLLEHSKFGIKKCAEFFDPHYLQDYNLTDEYFVTAMSGKYLNIKGGHLLDAMMRFVTWTYSIHFDQTKEIVSEVLTDFFRQMYQEAIAEYEKSDDKNAVRLANTLEKITKLEDYTISEKMGIKINAKNRAKINKKIEKLITAQ
ncbi:MAG: HD domain-containing protein [Alphaproteobacteria bacterium]|nr:HD domain-containing protein [Alphaproteobacteria bacterium]